MEFTEATHIVEILREAGPEGASVTEIANKATDIRRAKDPKAPELESSKISMWCRDFSSGRLECT